MLRLLPHGMLAAVAARGAVTQSAGTAMLLGACSSCGASTSSSTAVPACQRHMSLAAGVREALAEAVQGRISTAAAVLEAHGACTCSQRKH